MIIKEEKIMRLPLFSVQKLVELKWAWRSGVERKMENEIWDGNEVIANREK